MKTLKIARDTKVVDAAGAIAGQLRSGTAVQLQAIGAAAVNQAVKSIALAESYMAEEGKAVASRIRMVKVSIGERTTTAVRFLVWSTVAPERRN